MIVRESQNKWIKYKDKLIDLSDVNHVFFDWDIELEMYEITFYWKSSGGTSIEFTAEEKAKAELIFQTITKYLNTIDLESINEI